jgi:pyridoxamine 5'-phosphate oxidase
VAPASDPTPTLSWAASPLDQFAAWFAQAQQTEPVDPNAMTLATVGPDGRPSARILLLKGVDHGGFVFYTNTTSRKGRELIAHPVAAMTFHWKSLGRQVRVEGAIARVTDAEADAYYATRPYLSQIGAWASLQSQRLDSRATLEERLAEFSKRYPEGSVPRPPHWSGFRLTPDLVEFWENREFRLHDRHVYRAIPEGWLIEILYP